MIPIYMPKVSYLEDPVSWEKYYTDRAKRIKLYKKMYEVDKNEWSYVYGLVKNGEILYVGISKTPYKRYKDHLRKKLENDWNISLSLLGKGNKTEMLIVESKMIKKYKPPLNRRLL